MWCFPTSSLNCTSPNWQGHPILETSHAPFSFHFHFHAQFFFDLAIVAIYVKPPDPDKHARYILVNYEEKLERWKPESSECPFLRNLGIVAPMVSRASEWNAIFLWAEIESYVTINKWDAVGEESSVTIEVFFSNLSGTSFLLNWYYWKSSNSIL